MALTLSDLLKKMLEMGGSDLHLTTNSPPQVRVHGSLRPLDMPALSPSRANRTVPTGSPPRSTTSVSGSAATLSRGPQPKPRR